MSENDLRRMWEQLELSPEADDRIRRALEAACSEQETEVIQMSSRRAIRRRAPRTAAAAVIAAAVLTVAALAVAASRIDMSILRFDADGVADGAAVTAPGEAASADTEPDEAASADTEPYSVEISFDEIDGEWIGLGSWYPQEIPDGYAETFVSDALDGRYQRIVFENARGQYFDFEVRTAGPGLETGMEAVISEQAVTVGGHSGTLFRSGRGTSLLVWTDETRGLGFTMRTDDAALDLLAVARSVAELDTPLTPTRAAEYGKTLEEIGDYTITALPEGYAERSMIASDLSSDWYRYVRRRYENAAHDEIYFCYETFAFADDNPDPRTAETVIGYHGGGGSVTVNGLPGGVSDGRLVWVDWERSLVFLIRADGFTADALLAMAESVAPQ